MDDVYELSARYYDQAYAAKSDLVDEGFYLGLAEDLGGNVLEVGCGTGRILLPTARQGSRVHGLDKSPSMLSVLRRKIAQEPSDVRQRIAVHEGDMRTFELADRFRLITIPFRAIQHMYTLDDQLAALRNVALHLEPEGRFVFDVFFPKLDRIWAGVGEEVHELEWDTGDGHVIRRAFLKEEINKVDQWFRGRFIFRTYQGDELVRTEEASIQMAYMTYPQCHALFRLAGLRLVDEWGSFERTPLDNDAEQMIFALGR